MTTLTQVATVLSYHDLYAPPDVDEAVTQWQASCGPAALAAVLQCPMATLREAVMAQTPYATKGYMNPSHVLAVLHGVGVQVCTWNAAELNRDWPPYGLGFVQWQGPWLNPGVPIAAQYRRTHWIGLAMTAEQGQMIYDINAWDRDEHQGAWVPLPWWRTEVAPAITRHLKRASGGWYLRLAYAVTLPHVMQERL